LDPPPIAEFLGPGNWLISKVRVGGPDHARDAIDLAAATVDASAGIVERAIFSEELIDGRTPTRGVVFTEDVVKIAGQQGRYAVGHGLSPRPFPRRSATPTRSSSSTRSGRPSPPPCRCRRAVTISLMWRAFVVMSRGVLKRRAAASR